MATTFESLERRQLMSGTAVASFGTAGKATAELNPHSYTYNALDSAIDPYGRTIIGATYNSHDQFTLTRLTASGAMDYSFSGDSHVVQAVPDADAPIVGSHVFRIAVDHTGRTLVINDNTIYRYAVNGKIDTTFGSNGSEAVPVVSRATDLTVDARNRPIIVGTSAGVYGSRATVVRLGIAGVLDTSFGSGGAYKRPVPQDPTYQKAGNGEGLAVTVLGTGTIMAAGSATYQYNSENSRNNINATELFRLNADGSIDTTYGKKGHLQFQGRSDDVTSGGADLAALLPSGAAVIGIFSSSFDSPTPIGSSSYSYVNVAGATTGTGLTLRPKTTAYPRSEFDTTRVIGEDAAGRFLISSNSLVYRINPKNFKYDSTFGFVSGAAISAMPIGSTAINLFSRTVIGDVQAPGIQILEVTA